VRLWTRFYFSVCFLMVTFCLQAQTPAAPGSASSTPSSPPPIPATHEVLGDYVPCLFDDNQTLSFRAKVAPAPLVGESRADALIQGVNSRLGAGNTISTKTEDLLNHTYADATDILVSAITNSKADAASKTAANQYLTTLSQTPEWPNDVSCSVSLLSYAETQDVFGRRVASRYVAFQVNVRNLNANSEFLVHDIQVAVDTGTSTDYFGRFESSRDKLIVRGVAQIGQTDDRRNRLLNFLTMLGSIGGGANAELQVAAANTSAAANFSTAIAIFQGAVLTGLANIFPDHTIDFVNHINDLSFSASSTSKTVVPTKGSVPLVTFIAERPLEQLPFAYCGQKTSFRSFNRYERKQENSTSFIDYCKNPLFDGSNLVMTEYPKALTYANWSGAALRILEARTYVVVGGVHITETATAPTLQQLNCPRFEGDGPVDLSVATSGSLACTITGASLDKAGGVAIEQGSQRVAGTIQATQNGSSATILFTAAALDPLSGTYTLDWVSPGNPDTASGATLNFVPRPPIVNQIDYKDATNKDATVPFTGKAPITSDLALTFLGTDLDQLQAVTLTCGTSSKTATLAPFNGEHTIAHTVTGTRIITFAQADLTALGAGACTLSATSSISTSSPAVTLPETSVTLQ